jgi:hypothetical protein
VSVALVIQHAKRMRRIILSSVACLAVPYFSTLCHERWDCRGKKVIEHKMCILIFPTIFFWSISHSKKHLSRYYHKYTSVLYMSVILCQILIRFELSRQIFEKYSNIKFQGNPSRRSRVVACRQTDRHDEAKSRFSPCCEKRLKTTNYKCKTHFICPSADKTSFFY